MLLKEQETSVLKDPAGTELGTLLNAVLRKMNVQRLNDFFIGCLADYTEDEARVYFSDEVQETELQALCQSLEGDQVTATLEKSDEAGAAWMLVVVPADLGVSADGVVDVCVDLYGDIPVHPQDYVAEPETT